MLFVLIVLLCFPLPTLSSELSLNPPKSLYSTHITNSQTDTSKLDPNVALFFLAVQSNNLSKIQELLDKGMNPDSRDLYYRTPLMYTSDNNLGIAELLFKYNASANARDSYGNTALMTASENGSAQLVKLLLSKKSLINLENRERLTALSFAVQNGHAAVTELLIKSGASLSFRYPDQKSLLAMSVLQGNTDIVRQLLKTSRHPNELILASQTPLIGIASVYGYNDIVDMLIEAGADVNKKNNQNASPLMLAVVTKNYRIIELLLQAGANIKDLEIDGNTWQDYIPAKDKFIESTIQKHIDQQAEKLKTQFL